jgi:hypothetical protein
VSETGLLIAQAAFVVLLYGFIWLVVRSSSKQVGTAIPPPPPPVIPPETGPFAAATDLDLEMPEAEPDLLEASGALPAEEPVLEEPVLEEPILDEVVPAEVIPDEPALADAGQVPGEGLEEEVPSGAFDLTDASRPRLIVESSPVLTSGAEFALEGGMTIGRSPSSGVLVDDDFVSHMHARVMRRGEFYFISDLGSTNGTSINGRAIDEERQLRVHDEIQLGETVLRYEE